MSYRVGTKIYDITPPVSPKLPVWPGDNPFTYQIQSHIDKGDTVTLSTIRTTVHVGAHADAPLHYGSGGTCMGERDIHYFIGPCQVIEVPAQQGEALTPKHLGEVAISQPRVLLRTNTNPDIACWRNDFASLSPELIHYLHQQGVILIGVDTPSVDSMTSKDLPAHQQLFKYDMSVIEGLLLKDVPPGTYELIAPPLKLMGVDGSPIRALLREIIE